MEGYKPQWDPKVFDGTHPDQEFKEINYCRECGKDVTHKIIMEKDPVLVKLHGGYKCPFCNYIEPMINTFYQCSLCLKEHEKEECNCYEN